MLKKYAASQSSKQQILLVKLLCTSILPFQYDWTVFPLDKLNRIKPNHNTWREFQDNTQSENIETDRI
jgi:hypothetical protein